MTAMPICQKEMEGWGEREGQKTIMWERLGGGQIEGGGGRGRGGEGV